MDNNGPDMTASSGRFNVSIFVSSLSADHTSNGFESVYGTKQHQQQPNRRIRLERERKCRILERKYFLVTYTYALTPDVTN